MKFPHRISLLLLTVTLGRIVSHGCWSLSNFRGADYLPAFKHLMDARRTTTWTNWQGVIPGSINMQKSLKLLQPAFDQEKL
jgi:hypothetical protein